jgi:RNase H-fold protein (predicted Holliday junction resolvase)
MQIVGARAIARVVARSPAKRILALDYGVSKTGVALCDLDSDRFCDLRPIRAADLPRPTPAPEAPVHHTPHSRSYVAPTPARSALAERVAMLIAQHQASALLVGLPLGPTGLSTPACQRVVKFLKELRESGLISVPVAVADEYGTSIAAKQLLLRGKKRLGGRDMVRVDGMAARVMLESYVEALRPALNPQEQFSTDSGGDDSDETRGQSEESTVQLPGRLVPKPPRRRVLCESELASIRSAHHRAMREQNLGARRTRNERMAEIIADAESKAASFVAPVSLEPRTEGLVGEDELDWGNSPYQPREEIERGSPNQPRDTERSPSLTVRAAPVAAPASSLGIVLGGDNWLHSVTHGGSLRATLSKALRSKHRLVEARAPTLPKQEAEMDASERRELRQRIVESARGVAEGDDPDAVREAVRELMEEFGLSEEDSDLGDILPVEPGRASMRHGEAPLGPRRQADGALAEAVIGEHLPDSEAAHRRVIEAVTGEAEDRVHERVRQTAERRRGPMTVDEQGRVYAGMRPVGTRGRKKNN